LTQLTPDEILRRRRENQRLARTSFRKPEDVVAWFGALQAQDYLGSLWAIGLRMRHATEALVESAQAHRAIVRTWPMRGTLHFVAAADARWLTRLLAPRVMARNAARLKRDVDVDELVVGRSREVVTRALEGGQRLERTAVYAALEGRGIRTANSRGLHILLCLAMEGTLCLAGRQGKQHTFALLDEWLPQSKHLERDDALAALACRYFTSHGPATIKDFMWWAGITTKDATVALDGAAVNLAKEDFAGSAYWQGKRPAKAHEMESPQVKLLPAFDEYTVAYQDRALLVDPASRLSKMGILGPVVVIDGRVVGLWKRTVGKTTVNIAIDASRKLTGAQSEVLQKASQSYADFLGLDLVRKNIARRR
jgi:Winged helix DNA-binding domain